MGLLTASLALGLQSCGDDGDDAAPADNTENPAGGTGTKPDPQPQNPQLDFTAVPALSKSEIAFGDDISVKVATSKPCSVVLKIGGEEVAKKDSEGEVSVSIPTVVKSGNYTAAIIISDGETSKQCSLDYKIGLPAIEMVEVKGGEQSFDFQIGKYEVTQALWYAVMGENPSTYTEKNEAGSVKNNSLLPVESVSWNVIVNDFLPAHNALTGKAFRLPSNEEWGGGGARGGENTSHFTYSGSNDVEKVAWYSGNCMDLLHNGEIPTHPVGCKEANELGIFDMSGNVMEWCRDLRDTFHACRGGSWSESESFCSVYTDCYFGPDEAHIFIGFRLAL